MITNPQEISDILASLNFNPTICDPHMDEKSIEFFFEGSGHLYIEINKGKLKYKFED
jgi:hypothetical protein